MHSLLYPMPPVFGLRSTYSSNGDDCSSKDEHNGDSDGTYYDNQSSRPYASWTDWLERLRDLFALERKLNAHHHEASSFTKITAAIFFLARYAALVSYSVAGCWRKLLSIYQRKNCKPWGHADKVPQLCLDCHWKLWIAPSSSKAVLWSL